MSIHKEMKQSLNINSFIKMKENNDIITCLTAYDYTSAKILDNAGIDLILIGDSLGMVMNGYNSTIPVTIDEIIYHTKAVKRAVMHAFVVADMPFGSYHIDEKSAVKNAVRLVKETEVPAVKLEGGKEIAPLIEKLVNTGIGVLGHIGLKPQMVNTMGGYKIFGKDGAESLIEDAKTLENAGAFAVVLEGVSSQSAVQITNSINIPTIGIGAGSGCSGQILVYHDIFGIFTDFKPKFVKRYANVADIIDKAAKEYINDVKAGTFPDDAHSFK
ncbi:3-methyl-2-oxobutanoate hydroxymethyltransferase [Mucispirillum schaedleri ASF457]|uniref:3-methyl-2-oxobutanoate hydroxymethyltransferase n=2 Tax=Mucispirillum TaxID=248038 RepID=V2QE72_9BACT|nr:3-methyl-2-oxobutanoate hydroxymethyltransferase [Mucispirillum schaedleri ASF457]SIW04966.1 3-methyl-2-oxobutanoate hydroxymethyltransferase [Mucispirillum schaedleri ASF457]